MRRVSIKSVLDVKAKIFERLKPPKEGHSTITPIPLKQTLSERHKTVIISIDAAQCLLIEVSVKTSFHLGLQ